jgi:riboflavin kinase/FMN adenylyltransferase
VFVSYRGHISTSDNLPAQPSAGPDDRGSLTAIVELGEQRGRLLGFPTANLYPPDSSSRPRGVYAAVARTSDGNRWAAAVNVGTRPTFTGDASRVSIEVHLIGFDADIYGQALEVTFVQRLRDEVRFESIDALIAQLGHDVEAARDAVHELGHDVENAHATTGS